LAIDIAHAEAVRAKLQFRVKEHEAEKGSFRKLNQPSNFEDYLKVKVVKKPSRLNVFS